MHAIGIEGLEAFANLTYLDLSSNQITDGDFTNLSEKLTFLKIESNKISGELTVDQEKLTSLNASHNQIESLDELGMFALVNLRTIDLSNNKLTGRLGDYLTPSNKLTYANLSYNMITCNSSWATEGDGYVSLVTLNLQYNKLIKIGSVKNLTSLKRLNLEGNSRFNCSSLEVSGAEGRIDLTCPAEVRLFSSHNQ